jgi:hypothetical protein
VGTNAKNGLFLYIIQEHQVVILLLNELLFGIYRLFSYLAITGFIREVIPCLKGSVLHGD